VVEKLGAVNLRIQKSARANTPAVMEADALPIMFGDVERNAPNSSDD